MSIESSSGFFRGGSWDRDPRYARVDIRLNCTPGVRFYDLGVRLVRRCT